MSDIISSPDHYVKGRKYQPLDVMTDWGLIHNHHLACAFKYISRCGRKDDPILDLKKAIFYLTREIERLSENNVLYMDKRDEQRSGL